MIEIVYLFSIFEYVYINYLIRNIISYSLLFMLVVIIIIQSQL